jgi:hypothetical protein
MAEDKKIETEEEMKKRLKAEIMAELRDELKADDKAEPVKEKAEKNKEEKAAKVTFEKYNDKGLDEVNELNRKDRTREEKKEFKKFSLPKAPDDSETGSLNLVVVLVALIGMAVLIIFLPDIYKQFNKEKPSSYVDPNASNTNPPVELEKITLSSKIIDKFTYPIMRNSRYSVNTYYSKNSITMSEFSNNDILYNAFIHVYKGNLADYKGSYNSEYCGTAETKKTFNANYIDARIANLFTKSTEYTHANFVVPNTNRLTEFVGTWKYDSKNNRYIYYGDCVGEKSVSTVYYDLKSAYEAEGTEKNTVISVSYYMGFAKINTNTKEYTIYSDLELSTALTTGTLTTNNYENELNQIFNTYLETNKNLKKYKYTFSNNDCSYKDYCFEKGEWIE